MLLAAYKQHEVQLDGKCGSLEIPESKKKNIKQLKILKHKENRVLSSY